MAGGGTDDADLNFTGGFAEGAASSIAAADALADALKRMTERADDYRDPKMAKADAYRETLSELRQIDAMNAKIAAFDPQRTRALAQQEALLRKMREDALGTTEEAQARATASNDRALNLAVAEGLERAGEKLITAGIDLAKDAAQLLLAADKLAISESSKAEVQGAALERLGGNSYESTVRMALRLGLDPDKAVEETKRLLTAKFDVTEIPALLHLKAGMDLAGRDGEALLDKLSKIQLEPKVKAKDVEGLAKLGVDAKKVYEELAQKMGTDVATAAAKVKHGLADSQDVIAAIRKVAEDQYGGLADTAANSVEALGARVKGDAQLLFGGLDLGPVKDVLKNIAEVLEGPDGEAIKGAISELMDNLNHAVLDEFRGEEGKEKLRKFATDAKDAIHELATAVKDAGPAIKLIERLTEGTAGQHTTIFDTLGHLSGVSDSIQALNLVEAVFERLDSFSLDGLTASVSGFVDEARRAGDDLVNGLAQGIEEGASKAIDAAADMAARALEAAERVLLIRSPSQAFAEVGGYSAEGMAVGMDAHPGPEAAGRAMASRALDAAAGAAGGAGAAGAVAAQGGRGGDGGDGAPGGDLNITVNVHGGAQAAAQTWQELEPIANAWWRRKQRDRFESAGALG